MSIQEQCVMMKKELQSQRDELHKLQDWLNDLSEEVRDFEEKGFEKKMKQITYEIFGEGGLDDNIG